MFLLSRPDEAFIRHFLKNQDQQPFSYEPVGCTRTLAQAPLPNFTMDHNRICLGTGATVFQKAVSGIRQWRMFDLAWLSICFPDAPIEAGTVVAVLARPFWPWSLSPCRILYVIDERNGEIDRFGFAYGTLPEHVARGEERFSVEWNHADDSVWYDILAYSGPRHILTRIGYPVTRRIQKRFANESKQAMLRAVHSVAGT
jgi:uncharacterized protein (UPF0548 family)